ncbi:MAG: hypothetical protein LBP95_04200 [Deltaproteobacteria bacterium]|nr:hypothetical protein [Deltaproteobacteria bacterium]
MSGRLVKGTVFPIIMAFLAASMLLAAGCGAGKLGQRVTKVEHYPNCYKPIDDLRRDAEQLKKNVLIGAGVGAAAGAAVGAAVGGDLKSILIGAAIGAVSGAVGTYLVSDSVQEKAAQERLKAYNSTIDAETKNLQTAVQAAGMASNCYNKAYDALKADYQKSKITKDDMLARLKEIRDGNSEALTIMRNYRADATKYQQTFAEVVRQEQARPSDKLSRNQVNQVKRRAAAYDKVATDTDQRIARLSRQNEIINSNIENRDIASEFLGRVADQGDRDDRDLN